MFDPVACAYDLLAADPERLRREGPFLERWVGTGVAILDLACGTGIHAAFLAGGGHRRITAVDLSPAMIDRAHTTRPHPAITWQVGDMRDPPRGPFDRGMILGNALNLLPDRAAVATTLQAIRQNLLPGGSLLVQVVNPEHPRHRQPRQLVRRGAGIGAELTIIKDLVPHGDRTLLSLAVFARHPDGRMTTGGEQAVLLDLTAPELTTAMQTAGFVSTRIQGDLQGASFDAGSSPDVVIAAAV